MRRIIEDKDISEFDNLLGKNVLVLCLNYFYFGKLIGANSSFIELEESQIVYETGKFSNKKWEQAESLPSSIWYIRTSTIESYGEVTK